MEAPSFASRRPAATSLPAFSLPPPDIPSTRYPASTTATASSESTAPAGGSAAQNSLHHHYLTSSSSSQPSSAHASQPHHSHHHNNAFPSLPAVSSSVLTPTSGVTADGLSPLSSGVNSGSSQSSQPGTTPGMYYSHVPGTWPSQGGTSSSTYSFAGNGPNTPSGGPSSLVQPPYQSSRSMYPSVSPSMQHHFNNSGRAASSPGTADGLSNPSYQESSSLLNPISGAGGGSQPSQGPSQQSSASQNPPASGPPPTENSYRPSHQYYPPSSTPQQPPYSPFAHHPQHSPNVSSAPPSSSTAPRTASISGQPGHLSGMAPPISYGHERSHPPHYAGYHLPGNPVLSNMHHPGTPLAMVGGVNGLGLPPSYGQQGPHSLAMYAHGAQNPQQDRPFKCDQCPQSFNRNHDLKRHKRIHLAVKPFPCTFCEKSFSRKDALKVRKLRPRNRGWRRNTRAKTDRPPHPGNLFFLPPIFLFSRPKTFSCYLGITPRKISADRSSTEASTCQRLWRETIAKRRSKLRNRRQRRFTAGKIGGHERRHRRQSENA